MNPGVSSLSQLQGIFLNQESNQGLLHCRQTLYQGFHGGSDGKASACNAGDQGSIPGSGKPLEKEMATLHHSCLENSMDGGAWWATVHRITKSQTQLSDFTFLSLSLPAELPEKPTHDLCWSFYFYEIFLIFHPFMAEASFSPASKLQNVSLSFEDNDRYHGSISNERKKRGERISKLGRNLYLEHL